MTYQNVFDALNSTVWAITPDKFDQISAFVNGLTSKETLDFALDADKHRAAQAQDGERTLSQRVGVTMNNGTATVPIRGTMMKRMNMFAEISGGTSTEMLTGALSEVGANKDIKRVVFRIDSPGGSAEGLTALRNAIRDLPQETVTIADDMMASAAYFVGSAADRVVATPDAMVGSIGTVVSRWDYSEAYEGAGIKQHIWRSGPYKALGHSSEPLTTNESKETQELVDRYFQNFVQVVAENRFNGNLEQAEAVADGRVYVGADAVTKNLVDEVMTVEELYADLDAKAADSEKLGVLEPAFADAQAKIESLEGENADLKTQIEQYHQKAVADKQAAAEQKANTFIEQLVEKGKIAAAADHSKLRANLVTNFEAYSEVFDLVPEGSAAPGSFTEATEPKADLDAKVAEAKANGIPVAYSPAEAKVYEDFKRTEGSTDKAKHYVKAYAE